MAKAPAGSLAWVRHFPWLISTFTARGVWLGIPISQLEKLCSERRSDLSRDKKTARKGRRPVSFFATVSSLGKPEQ